MNLSDWFSQQLLIGSSYDLPAATTESCPFGWLWYIPSSPTLGYFKASIIPLLIHSVCSPRGCLAEPWRSPEHLPLPGAMGTVVGVPVLASSPIIFPSLPTTPREPQELVRPIRAFLLLLRGLCLSPLIWLTPDLCLRCLANTLGISLSVT